MASFSNFHVWWAVWETPCRLRRFGDETLLLLLYPLRWNRIYRCPGFSKFVNFSLAGVWQTCRPKYRLWQGPNDGVKPGKGVDGFVLKSCRMGLGYVQGSLSVIHGYMLVTSGKPYYFCFPRPCNSQRHDPLASSTKCSERSVDGFLLTGTT